MSIRILENSTANGLATLASRIKAGEFYVKVGVPDSPAVDEDGHASGKVTVGDVAQWLEFGTATAPERPVFRNGIRNNVPEFQRLNKVNLMMLSEGKITIDRALGQLGAVAAGKIKKEFGSAALAPNRPSTIARKGSSKPGIDTGQLRQSVTFEVIGRG